jgi:hypothetical protein|tara:strand:- start:291 stop:605 length:315 start_codon:yes stop_codon:yes gene_type:complete
MKKDICDECGEIHDVEKANGHDLLQAQRIAICECKEFPNDEYCREILKEKEVNIAIKIEELLTKIADTNTVMGSDTIVKNNRNGLLLEFKVNNKRYEITFANLD